MIENERKFLLNSIPKEVYFIEKQEIIQFYLCQKNDIITRVRRYGKIYNIGIKSGKGIKRLEKEITITKQDFDDLLLFNPKCKIRKFRHICKIDKFKIEVDEFKDNLQGLLMAEVEFANLQEAKAFSPPDWFGKEVTNDIRYTNAHLSKTQKIPE